MNLLYEEVMLHSVVSLLAYYNAPWSKRLVDNSGTC